MSYILDALRRADSERERERSAVPGLHTQAVPVGAADGEGDAPSNPWKWPIVAAFIGLLGLVAWLWLGRADTPEPAGASAPARPPLVAPPPAVAPLAPAAPPPSAAASTPAANTAAATSAGAASAPSARKPAPAATARKPPAAAMAPSAPVAAKTTARASEPEARISTLSELPEEIRRELPTLAVGGSIYSKSAANRMLVINGQVFHEGDELASGLVLEQIKQKAAVLKYKSYRYEITY